MIVNGKRVVGLEVRKEKATGDYLYMDSRALWCNMYQDVYATMQEGDVLPSCHTSASVQFINEDCTLPIPFGKLPENVQKHLTNYTTMLS